jgi:hypothetical protein
VTDDDVLESFTSSVDPANEDAWMLSFIELGQIMLLIGDCMFVHGGIRTPALGAVPGEAEVQEDAQGWCEGLNRFKTNQVNAYKAQPGFVPGEKAGEFTRAAAEILDYGVPNGNGGKTVVYENFLCNGNCEPPSYEARARERSERKRSVLWGELDGWGVRDFAQRALPRERAQKKRALGRA